ncbi:MAG: DUF1844 domain-containing protein [Planctomycetota bacterium]|jgi:hypothetical protein
MADEEKKIIIDEDWKQQAQKEKEVLKEQEKLEHEEAEQPAQPQLPEADFTGLVSMLATQAFYALGVIRAQEDKDKEIQPDFQVAKFNIDMLGMLEEKCKDNMTDEEAHLLKSTLEQLRMLFVQLSKKD